MKPYEAAEGKIRAFSYHGRKDNHNNIKMLLKSILTLQKGLSDLTDYENKELLRRL